MYFPYEIILDDILELRSVWTEVKTYIFKIVNTTYNNYVYKQLIIKWIIILIVARCRSPGLLL